jgi:hypothetical protein
LFFVAGVMRVQTLLYFTSACNWPPSNTQARAHTPKARIYTQKHGRDGGRVWGVRAQRGGRREKVKEKDRCSRRKKM